MRWSFWLERITGGCVALYGKSGCCRQQLAAGMVIFKPKDPSRWVPGVFFYRFEGPPLGL